MVHVSFRKDRQVPLSGFLAEVIPDRARARYAAQTMEPVRSTDRLRIAALLPRPQALLHDLWRSMQRHLARVPGCTFAQFDSTSGRENMARWRPDGAIVHAHRAEMLDFVLQLGIPVVNTSGILEVGTVPTVIPDNHAVGAMAAEHLLSKGYRHYAYAGLTHFGYGRLRLEGFRGRVNEAGPRVAVYEGPIPGTTTIVDMKNVREQPLARWLASLPSDCAIFTDDDTTGAAVIAMLHVMGIDPLERFAILSGHDREAPTNPPLSGVRIPEERWGYEAARLLVRMVGGEPAPPGPVLLAPLGVSERETTLGVASRDGDLREAMQFIRNHAASTITVDDVVASCSIGRRALERRFVEHLGRTILQEIHRAHLEQAKRLLIETDLSMRAVARESGLADERHLWRLLNKYEHITPASFRRKFRVT